MSSHCSRIKYYTARDGESLATRVWEQDDALAEIVYLHGIVSHGGWYESSCSHLAADGFQVHFLERRGSGLNQKNPGDVDDWNTWLTDVQTYLQQLPKDRPRIVLGISWGGILATALARRCPELIDAFGLICPGLYSFKAANRFQRTALRAAAALGLGRHQVEVPLQAADLFTNSGKWRKYIDQDPLALRRITIRFGLCNLALLRYAIEAPGQIDVPVMLMLASGDPVTDNAATQRFFDRLGSSDRTIIEYAGASHTLEFEDDPDPYFNDLSQWCTRIATREVQVG